MLRAMLRDLRAHKGRIVMTLLAITLGVAFVVATWVVSDSTAATLSGAGTRTDVDVSVQAVDRSPNLTAADRDRLASVPGVASADGIVVGRAGLVGADGKLVAGQVDLAGTYWDSSQRFDLVDGQDPAPGEVALGEQQAHEAGYRIGDTARILLADGRPVSATVAGVYAYRSLGEPDPPVAFGSTDVLGTGFTRIELHAKPGANLDTIAASVRAGIDDKLRTVQTGPELVANAQARADASATAGRESLLGFAAVALLVGMFVIANTFAMLVTQRTRQLALLRAVGASRRQVRRAVLVEAGVLGWMGATLGVGVGIGVGALALRIARPDGQSMAFSVSPNAILVGYAVGVVVTVLAAYGSSRRAATVSPMAALRTDATIPRRSLMVRTMLGIAALVVGVGMILTALPNALSTTQRVIGLGGGIVCWLGVLLLAPMLATAVLRPLGRLLSRHGGPATRLAVRNSVRDPRRTAATTSALMVGLALVCAFATLSESMVSMLTSSLRASVPASAVVLQSPTKNVPLATDVLAKVQAMPGARVSADRYGYVKVTHNGSTSTTTVSAVEPDGVVTPRIVAGTGDVRQGAVVGRNEAAMLGVDVGDHVSLEVDPTTTINVPVVGLHDGTEAQPLFYVEVAQLPVRYRDTRVTTVYALGVDKAAVSAAFQDRPDVVVTDQQGLVDSATKSFELLIAIMYALFGAAIVIAAFGVVNTLALSVMERTRELGLIRAVGATRRLVRTAVRLESVVICGYGGLLGIVVGVGFGAVMQHVMLGQDLWRISVPVTVTASALLGMVVVGVLAAVWPARRAARTDILTAIAS
jgi:putative ABC transport system permease protein